jgi:hypothetical protein
MVNRYQAHLLLLTIGPATMLAAPETGPGQEAAPAGRTVEYKSGGCRFGLKWTDGIGRAPYHITYGDISSALLARVGGKIYDVDDMRALLASAGIVVEPAFQYCDTQGNDARVPTDWLRISYTVTNQDDKRAQEIELRLMVDTLLDAEEEGVRKSFDVHPFVVPNKFGMITKSADFRTPATVPPYFKAVTPTTTPVEVIFLLRPRAKGVVGPYRCVFTNQSKTMNPWDIEARDMYDSGFYLYWSLHLAPGERRTIAFDCCLRLPPQ